MIKAKLFAVAPRAPRFAATGVPAIPKPESATRPRTRKSGNLLGGASHLVGNPFGT